MKSLVKSILLVVVVAIMLWVVVEIGTQRYELESLSNVHQTVKNELCDKQKEINKLQDELRVVNERNTLAESIVAQEQASLVLPEVIENVVGGVVHIDCPQWQGSGFVIGPNLIVTARHCVENVEDFIITTYEGHKLCATRAISSKNHDIAFIYIDDLTCIAEKERELGCKKVTHKVVLKPLELGSIKDCVLGQEVFAIGSPYGKINFNSVTSGIVSGVDRNYDELNRGSYGQVEDYGWSVAFSTDAAGHPGNSGCPIFTMDGVVRGVLVGGMSDVLIIVMPMDLILEDIEEVMSMFIQSKYRFEKISDNRFDNMYDWYQRQRNDRRLDEVYYWYIGAESILEDLKQMADVVRRYVDLIATYMDSRVEVE